MVIRSITQPSPFPSVLVTAPPFAPRSTVSTTSSTEVTIRPSPPTLHFEVAGIGFSVAPGQRMRATAVDNLDHWAEGQVVSFDGTSVELSVDRVSGEGATASDWNLGLTGQPGAKGDLGEPGPQGAKGEPGPVTLQVRDTVTVEPNEPAKVINAGDSLNVMLDFELPRGRTGAIGPQGDQGVQGDAATIEVEGTTTLPAGGTASVTNVGDQHNARFEFVIPSGGPQGDQGPTGATGPPGTPGGVISTVAAPFEISGYELRLTIEPPLEVSSGKLTLRRAFQ